MKHGVEESPQQLCVHEPHPAQNPVHHEELKHVAGQVVMVEVLGGAEELRVLSLAASAERTSGHPLAAAIVGCAAARGAAADLPVAACTSLPGT